MSHRRLLFIAPVLLSLVVLAMLAGCGGKSDGDVILAEVGDREVTGTYYADRLSRLQPQQLPRSEEGETLDMATMEGKHAFLDVIINKELLVAKALQLGYDKDTQIEMAMGHLVEYNAMIVFWQDEIGDPSKFVSDADLEYYYSRLGERRNCQFIITNRLEDATTAREAIVGGMPWSEAVAKFHTAPLRGDTLPHLMVNWGQYRDEFERPVFAVAEGEVTEPVETEHGYWLLLVNEITMEPKPDLESIQGEVLLSISKRNENLRREDLKRSLAAKHNLFINEDALAIVFDGLPEEEALVDPKTNKPVTQADLKALDVPSSAYDMVFMSYDLSTGPYVMTVSDYKAGFDKQNVFERPKRGELLGGLRIKLRNAGEKSIMVDEARSRGYFENERVIDLAFARIEEMLVDKVQQEVIQYEEYITPVELEVFWAEHSAEYYKPERRSGFMVRCEDEAKAAQARAAILDESMTWKQANKQLGNDPALDQVFGRIVQMRSTETGPVRDTLFSLEADQMSQPVIVPGGWAVIQLSTILPPEEPTLAEAGEMVGARIRDQRMEEALQALLAEWREEFGVTIHEDALSQMPSWEEAVKAASEAQMSAATG